MIKDILDLLQIVDGDTENIRIAQGKYKLAETFKEGYQQLKKYSHFLECPKLTLSNHCNFKVRNTLLS